MKTNRSVILLSIMVILALVWTIWSAKRHRGIPVKPGESPNASQAEAIAPALHQDDSGFRANGEPATRSAPVADATEQAGLGKVRQMQELLAQQDVPIVFYGKVEDQFGNPVNKANIRFNIQSGLSGEIKKGRTVSDANGCFTVSGYTGERLSVIPEKPGHALASLNAGGIYSQLYPEADRIHPDPNSPVVIKMWKLQGAEPLVKINQSHKLRYTRSLIHFDLIAGKIVPNGGDLRITVTRSEGELSLRNRADWSARVEAVDDGLMDSSGREAVTYWAPDQGYQKSKTFLMSTNPPHKWFGVSATGFLR
jgi:hypothetical protein